MDAELKTRWVEALRSGEYKQGVGCLKNRETECFCCLGVLADLAGLELEDQRFANGLVEAGFYVGYTPLIKLTGVRDLSALWYRNDGIQGQKAHSFPEIADYIEKTL